jgi:3-hydroxybutyryl-CoA dehydrogenase
MEAKDIRTICNVGTGTMGHGTAVMFAKAGYSVRMYGRTPESIERGMKGIQSALETYRTHQLITDAEVPQILAGCRRNLAGGSRTGRGFCH